MTRARNRLALLLALPLAFTLSLGLGACGKKDDAASVADAAPLAAVAPPAGKAWADVVTQTPEGGYLMGNPNAPLKLIEYGSLTCPHCAEFSEKGLPTLRDTYVASGRVSLEFRNFVRDKYDTTMAMLTRCSSPDAFYGLTEQVYANQKDIFAGLEALGKDPSIATLSEDKLFPVIGARGGLVDFFAARGVAKDQALQCLANTKTATTLAEGVQKATDQYQITGTPSFILNGRNLDVATWEQLEPILKRAGAR
ncbi:thioredoxin domain-containing protein [Novosphingobium sp. FKTRR1]|uniref:thioredoxin domain-containing protein n=1 Tax=unclassified Novosphingobium TaxID=2644732 RepID=UPI001CF0985D|nr:thioredoxin domain-containing protein [Novosphingobium sp. FKTRR1]